MIEALYPIIGRLVVRAVSEAMRDLARTIDARIRKSAAITPRVFWLRLRARLSGVSSGEYALREALPFAIVEAFLIHRETGLLLYHTSKEPASAPDNEIISSMLTAIRDFAREAFGRGQAGNGSLDEIQYGDRRILIEAAQHAYLAVVVDGVEPLGFRAEMREQIMDIQNRCGEALVDYNGDSEQLAAVYALVDSLLADHRPENQEKAGSTFVAATHQGSIQ